MQEHMVLNLHRYENVSFTLNINPKRMMICQQHIYMNITNSFHGLINKKVIYAE